MQIPSHNWDWNSRQSWKYRTINEPNSYRDCNWFGCRIWKCPWVFPLQRESSPVKFTTIFCNFRSSLDKVSQQFEGLERRAGTCSWFDASKLRIKSQRNEWKRSNKWGTEDFNIKWNGSSTIISRNASWSNNKMRISFFNRDQSIGFDKLPFQIVRESSRSATFSVYDWDSPSKTSGQLFGYLVIAHTDFRIQWWSENSIINILMNYLDSERGCRRRDNQIW